MVQKLLIVNHKHLVKIMGLNKFNKYKIKNIVI